MSVKELQKYTFSSRYPRWLEDKNRRETWAEAVDRVKEMMLQKYEGCGIDDIIETAYSYMHSQKVLGSQRMLQFGGSPVLKHNARGYNCCASYVDRLDFFSQCMYLLLCGCGTGFSVQRHHIDKLPHLTKERQGRVLLPKKKFTIPDSIEGWSDSIAVLMSSYFESPVFEEYYNCEVDFDFSDIRPRGSSLSSCSGKAPGPEPLANSIKKIRELLSNVGEKLNPLQAYDTIMHLSDAVLAGGVRRSATICQFSFNDEEMYNAKIGDWYYKNPQRGRSNNSAILIRNKTTKEDFSKLIESTRQFGEPGFIWADDTEQLFNPSLRGDTKVLTQDGIFPIKSLEGKEVHVRNLVGEWSLARCRLSGLNKRLWRITLENGTEYYATAEHKWPIMGEFIQKKETHELEEGMALPLLFARKLYGGTNYQSLNQGWEDGKNFPDMPTQIWSNDESYRNGFLQQVLNQCDIEMDSITFPCGSNTLSDVLGFYGIIVSEGKIIDRCSLELCKYFLRPENKDKLEDEVFVPFQRPVKIKSVEETDLYEDVWDLSVYDDTHCFQLSHCITGNCVEAQLYGYDEQGNSGWQFCNLCSANSKKIKSLEQFIEFSEQAAVIGTLQAGFTDFPYLGKVSEDITKREALLGISLTGMMENADIILNGDNQRVAAEAAKKKNEEIAAEIGINASARITNIKPEGSTSCVLGTSSGIHPHHARRYFRSVQANTTEPIYLYFKKINPLACEKSLWSNNDSDDVVTFCIEVEKGAKLKNDLPAIELLKLVKLTQENWVKAGTVTERCVKPYLKHNVSNTINVKPEEWDEVVDFIYDNRESFAGVSLLPSSGDKDFVQAPFCAVYTARQIADEYGDGSLFASGVIESALLAFDNLWVASDAALGLLKVKLKIQKDWVAQAEKFAIRYFGGDVKKMTYCLKDVYNWKKWCDLTREFKEVDYEQCVEMEDNVVPEQVLSCAGGKCDI